MLTRGYQGYFDDSGKRDRPSTVVAGFVASVDSWQQLYGRWNELKEEHEIRLFHTADCEHGNGEFDKESKPQWKDPRARLQCKMDFVRAVTDTGLVPFVVGVVNADYDALTTNEKRRLGHRFSFLAQGLLVRIKDWANEANVYERFPYLFEAGTDGYGQFSVVFSKVMRDSSWRDQCRMESVGTVGKEHNAAQAADLLAYEHSHCMSSRINGDDVGFQRPAIIEFSRRLRIWTRYFDGRGLKEVLAQPKSGYRKR